MNDPFACGGCHTEAAAGPFRAGGRGPIGTTPEHGDAVPSPRSEA